MREFAGALGQLHNGISREAAFLADAGDRQPAIVVRGRGGSLPEILQVPLS